VQIPKEKEAQKRLLKRLKAEILDLGIPPEHEKLIMES
jgi:hypothetical protein